MALGDIAPERENLLAGSPVSAPDDLELARREVEERLDLERQINFAIDEINANPNIPSEIKSELVNNLRSLKTGLGANPNLAQVQKEINDARAIAHQASTTSAIYNSLSVAGQAAVNLRVAEQLDAIQDGDIVVIGRRLRGAGYDDLPPSIQQLVDDSTQAQLGSPYGQKMIQAVQTARAEQPEATEAAFAAIETRKTYLQEWLSANPDSPLRARVESMLQSGAYNMPASQDFVSGLMSGASPEQLQAAAAGADMQLRSSMIGAMATIREYSRPQIESIISLAPEESRARLSTDDAALARYLIETSNGISEQEREAAYRALERNGNDVSKLSARDRQIVDLAAIMQASNATSAMTGVLMQLGRTRELELAQNRGETLSASDQAHVANLQFIRDTSQPLVARADRLLDATSESLSHAASGLPQLKVNSRNSQLALATLTLAYIDQNGGSAGDGIAQFQEFAQRAERAKTSGVRDEQAEAYFANYQNFLSTSLIGEPLNTQDSGQQARLSVALEQAGGDLASQRIEAFSTPAGLSFLDRTDATYQLRSSVYTSSAQAFTSAYGGATDMMRQLYEESRAQDASAEFASIVRNMDTYRLQNDPGSESLIRDVWLGQRPLAEIRAELDQVIATERAGMQEYAGYAQASASEFQRQALAANNLNNPDGSINVEALMNRIEENKAIVYDYWRDYKDLSMDELRSSSDPRLQHLAQARALAELGTLMRSAHSIEHLTDRAEELEIRISSIQASGGTAPAHLLEDQRLLNLITQYDISNPEQGRDEFREALRTFLMRDAYVAEKEAADANKPEGERSNLVANTIALIESRLNNDREYSHAIQQGEHVTHDQPTQPSVTASPVSAALPSAPDLAHEQAFDTTIKIDSREQQGSAGLDGLSKSNLEKAILGAVQNLSPETRQQILGSLLGSFNEVDPNFISYNEIENAVRAVDKTKNSNEILAAIDSNGSGALSLSEITTYLANAGVSGGQGVVSNSTPPAQSVPSVAIVTPAPTPGR